MKPMLVAFLLAPLSALAYDVTDPQVVRVMDGHAVTCTQTYEGGRTAYVPLVKSLGVGTDGRIALSLDVSFQLCVRNGDNLNLAPRRPLDPVTIPNSDGSSTRIEFRTPELVLGDAELSRVQVASLTNERSEQVDYQFLPQDFLSASELADLAAGKPVRVRLAILYRSIGTSYTSQGETPLGYEFGGAYTLFFTLKK